MAIGSEDYLPAVYGLEYLSRRVECGAASSGERHLWESVREQFNNAVNSLKMGDGANAIVAIRSMREVLNAKAIPGVLREACEELQNLERVLQGGNDSPTVFQGLSNWWFKIVHFYRDTSRMRGSLAANRGVVLYRAGVPPHFLMIATIFVPFLLLVFADKSVFPLLEVFVIFGVSLILSLVGAALMTRFAPAKFIMTVWVLLIFIIPFNLFAFIFIGLDVPSPPDSVILPIVLVFFLVGVVGGLMIPPFTYVLIRGRSRQYGSFACVWLRRKNSGLYDCVITDSQSRVVHREEVKKPQRFLERFVGGGLAFLEGERLVSDSQGLWFQCYVAMTAPRHVVRFGKNKGRELLDAHGFFCLGKSIITENIFPDASLSTPGLTEDGLRGFFASNPPSCEPPAYA